MEYHLSLRTIYNTYTFMATSKEMTSGRPFPLIFNFALPLLLGNLLQQTYSLVDAAIVGQFLGINDLAAVGASTSVVFLILGFCNGCCGGFGIPVAQKFGARDYSTMRRLVSVSLQLAVVMSVVIAIVTSLFCADILKAMRTPETIFQNAYYYLLVTFIGVPCTFFYNLLSSIIRALGDSKTPFWFLLFSTVLNVLLDLFCILVLGWGVMGAAIATVISQGVSAGLCYFYMMRKFEILKATAAERKFQSSLARTLLYIGVPMGLQFSITAIGSIMLQSANNALGTACVAAFTAAMRIKMFCMCPLESLGIAMATYSGQIYGAGKTGLRLAVCRGIRAGDSERYRTVPAYIGDLLSGIGTALHSALYHSGSRIHQSGNAFGSIGNDCPHAGQSVCCAGMGISCRLLRRPHRMDFCRLVSDSGLYLCI